MDNPPSENVASEGSTLNSDAGRAAEIILDPSLADPEKLNADAELSAWNTQVAVLHNLNSGREVSFPK